MRLGIKIITSLWNLTGASAAVLPRHLSNFNVIVEIYTHLLQLQDFTNVMVRPLSAQITRWVNGTANILSHHGPWQYPLPQGHIVDVFHARASYRLPSLSFHDNQTSHSRDTISPWKFKVKGQGQRYPSQHCVQLAHFLSVSHRGILSTPVPFVPW